MPLNTNLHHGWKKKKKLDCHNKNTSKPQTTQSTYNLEEPLHYVIFNSQKEEEEEPLR